MSKSPGTPTGHGRRSSSTTQYCALSIGRPYGMLRQAGSTAPTRNQFDHMVASVAPPRLTIVAPVNTDRTSSGNVSGV